MNGQVSQAVTDKTTDRLPAGTPIWLTGVDLSRECQECGARYLQYEGGVAAGDRDLCVGCLTAEVFHGD